MKKWVKSYLLLEKDIETITYRKEVTGNFIIFFSFCLLLLLAISHFIYKNMTSFYINLSLFIGLVLIVLVFRSHKKQIVCFIVHFMCAGFFIIVYANKGQEYAPVWSLLYMYLIMSLYGHKIGLIICIGFLTLLFGLLFSYLGDTLTMIELIRLSFVSIFTLFFAYLAELLICRTFVQLHSTKRALEKMTITDELTNLHNRRHFNDILRKKINSAKRSKELLALAMIDIDHFKKHNDKFGHPAGDTVLVELSSLLGNMMKRSDDVLFRLGGEEFAILYKPQDEKSAITLMEKIRNAVEVLHEAAKISDKITISVGLLLIRSEQEMSLENAYKAGDVLLYKAKELGRNCVVVSS